MPSQNINKQCDHHVFGNIKSSKLIYVQMFTLNNEKAKLSKQSCFNISHTRGGCKLNHSFVANRIHNYFYCAYPVLLRVKTHMFILFFLFFFLCCFASEHSSQVV